MAKVYWVVIRDNDLNLRYKDGPFRTRAKAEQRLGEVTYEDPDDPTPPFFSIDDVEEGQEPT